MPRGPSGSCHPCVPPYPPPLATVTQYREVMSSLGIDRAVIVQPNAYGMDNRCTTDAVSELGDAARAVVVVTPQTSRDEIQRLHELGARGARFFLLRGAVMTWEMLAPVARLIADFGWHVQLQFDGRELPKHYDAIRALPCTAVIDHIGKFLEQCGTAPRLFSRGAFRNLRPGQTFVSF